MRPSRAFPFLRRRREGIPAESCSARRFVEGWLAASRGNLPPPWLRSFRVAVRARGFPELFRPLRRKLTGGSRGQETGASRLSVLEFHLNLYSWRDVHERAFQVGHNQAQESGRRREARQGFH